MADELRIDLAAEEDRFARFRLISWWDQQRLERARVLVVGAGALGNEIIKNLALLGIGHLFVADRDRIEMSNLSRSVLFRRADCGRTKPRWRRSELASYFRRCACTLSKATLSTIWGWGYIVGLTW